MVKKQSGRAAGGAKKPAGVKRKTAVSRKGAKKPRPAPKKPPVGMAMAVAGGGEKELKLVLTPVPVTAYNVNVDGAPIYFAGGKASRPISPGNHVLSWAIVHTPGVIVTIGITAPPEAIWAQPHEMPPSGRWDDYHPFYVYA